MVYHFKSTFKPRLQLSSILRNKTVQCLMSLFLLNKQDYFTFFPNTVACLRYGVLPHFSFQANFFPEPTFVLPLQRNLKDPGPHLISPSRLPQRNTLLGHVLLAILSQLQYFILTHFHGLIPATVINLILLNVRDEFKIAIYDGLVLKHAYTETRSLNISLRFSALKLPQARLFESKRKIQI